jgi:hypothetical protein
MCVGLRGGVNEYSPIVEVHPHVRGLRREFGGTPHGPSVHPHVRGAQMAKPVSGAPRPRTERPRHSKDSSFGDYSTGYEYTSTDKRPWHFPVL